MKFGVESGEVFVSAGRAALAVRGRRRLQRRGPARGHRARGRDPARRQRLPPGPGRRARRAASSRCAEGPDGEGPGVAPASSWRSTTRRGSRPPEAASWGASGSSDELQAAFARARDEQRLPRGHRRRARPGSASRGSRRSLSPSSATTPRSWSVAACPTARASTYRPLAEIVRQLGGRRPAAAGQELLEGDEPIAELVLGAIGLSDGAAQAEETFLAVRRLLERVAQRAPARGRRRGRPLGRADPARPARVPRRLLERAPDPARLPRAARVRGDAAGVGGAARRTGRCWCWTRSRPRRRAGSSRAPVATASARARRRGSWTRPRATRSSSSSSWRWERRVATRPCRRASRPCSPRASTVSSPASAPCSSTPRSRAGASTSARSQSCWPSPIEREHRDAPGLARPAAADPRRPLGRSRARTRFGSRTRSFARPRTRPAETAARGAARGAGPLARGAPGCARRDNRLPPRRGVSPPGRARPRRRARAGAGGGGGRAARGRGTRRAPARRSSGGSAPARAGGIAPGPGRSGADRSAAPLGAALLDAGRLADADRVLAEAIESAGGDPRLEARARVERQLVRLQAGSDAPTEDVCQIADSALTVLEAHGDELGQCRALCLRALQAWVEGRSARADEAWRRAAEHARRAGDEAALFEILDWRATAALFGPTPVPAAISRCREIQEQVRSSPVAVARTFQPLAALHAMAGDFDEADRLVRARRRGPRRARWSALGHSATGGPGRDAGRPTGGGRSEAAHGLRAAAGDGREGTACGHCCDARAGALCPGPA